MKENSKVAIIASTISLVVSGIFNFANLYYSNKKDLELKKVDYLNQTIIYEKDYKLKKIESFKSEYNEFYFKYVLNLKHIHSDAINPERYLNRNDIDYLDELSTNHYRSVILIMEKSLMLDIGRSPVNEYLSSSREIITDHQLTYESMLDINDSYIDWHLMSIKNYLDTIQDIEYSKREEDHDSFNHYKSELNKIFTRISTQYVHIISLYTEKENIILSTCIDDKL